MTEQFESLTRGMYEPNTSYLGVDLFDDISETAQRGIEAGRAAYDTWTGRETPTPPPESKIPQAALVAGILGMLLVAYAVGKGG